MPILVVGFAAASFGYGALLRGTDVVVNEVAIVRGAPDATEATAQVYFGVFSPTRSTYQVDVPRGALLASPINGDPFAGQAGLLDIVQGTGPEQPSAVRNLTVGTGSLRVVRAQLPITAPRMRATLTSLERRAHAARSRTPRTRRSRSWPWFSAARWSSSATSPAHEKRDVRIPIRDNQFGGALADQIVGPAFDSTNEAGIRRSTRYAMVSASSPTTRWAGRSASCPATRR